MDVAVMTKLFFVFQWHYWYCMRISTLVRDLFLLLQPVSNLGKEKEIPVMTKDTFTRVTVSLVMKVEDDESTSSDEARILRECMRGSFLFFQISACTWK